MGKGVLVRTDAAHVSAPAALTRAPRRARRCGIQYRAARSASTLAPSSRYCGDQVCERTRVWLCVFVRFTRLGEWRVAFVRVRLGVCVVLVCFGGTYTKR